MNKKLLKTYEEWLEQSDYDFETARAMFKTGRYIYSVFMCHLAVEKILKGLCVKTLENDPPKTHDLIYLAKIIGIYLPEKLKLFIDDLNDLSVPTRYPDELKELLKQYKKDKTKEMIEQTKEVLKWVRKT